MPTEPSYLNQEDTPTDPSNGNVDPATTDVHRKLFCDCTYGAGSCGGNDACGGVTSTSEIGVGSCTEFYSCKNLNGTYNDDNTRVYCMLYYMSTQLTVCNSSLLDKVLLVMDRALVKVPVLILMVRTMITIQECLSYDVPHIYLTNNVQLIFVP